VGLWDSGTLNGCVDVELGAELDAELGVSRAGSIARRGTGELDPEPDEYRRGAGPSARRRTADLGSIVAALRRGVAVGGSDPLGVCWSSAYRHLC
jgi:hypothetical protein